MVVSRAVVESVPPAAHPPNAGLDRGAKGIGRAPCEHHGFAWGNVGRLGAEVATGAGPDILTTPREDAGQDSNAAATMNSLREDSRMGLSFRFTSIRSRRTAVRSVGFNPVLVKKAAKYFGETKPGRAFDGGVALYPSAVVKRAIARLTRVYGSCRRLAAKGGVTS